MDTALQSFVKQVAKTFNSFLHVILTNLSDYFSRTKPALFSVCVHSIHFLMKLVSTTVQYSLHASREAIRCDLLLLSFNLFAAGHDRDSGGVWRTFGAIIRTAQSGPSQIS